MLSFQEHSLAGRRIELLPLPQCLVGRVLLCLIFFLFLIVVYPAQAQEAGRIVSIIGTVEVLRKGQWQTVNLREALLPGDVVRTGPGSRVAIQLADESQLKVNANSQLELKQVTPPTRPVAMGVTQTLLRLFSGEIWVRSYAEPLEIKTRAAAATIRGTELNLSTGPAEVSCLAVLEGLVEFRNLQGSVLVAAGEQATAKVGEAPQKTVLFNPLDAVQWSFYYPGIISYRDYPLSGLKPTLLRERLAQVERRVAMAPQDIEALLELGEVLFDLGRRGDARQAFEKALALAPQAPRVHMGLGWVYLEAGEVEAALNQFRQAQPPNLGALVGMANALYRLDRFEEALAVIADTKRGFPRSPMPWTQGALIYLVQGRVTQALAELAQASALDPNQALAKGLRSNIYLVQNQKDRALEAAQQAIGANPFSPAAYLDLSLVKQAEFKLEEALQAARKAVELDPENPQALIQVSRLLFGLGRISEAFKFAEGARRKAPQNPVVTAAWGFLQLAQDKVNEAIAAFDHAIAQDSTRGESHLGRGLAFFRRGKTEEGVREMRIATLLEPRVSLYHSYLGKALYEVKKDRLAEQQLALAKELDPRDPTPYFYDAIRKQSVNRPVEALHDLQKAIERNDNRAIYRSRLLLDQDLAARSAALGRIYNDLGFQQLGLVEGWKSVNTDPSNYSAHRLLADNYAALPRHEIARVSELLQSQLLQPINITPVQPSLAESNLLILEGSGPSDLSFNEFNPLFTRNRLALQASGVFGSNNILGDEVTQSGVWGKFSYSLGQFHFETDGFRENNDLKQDIYNAFLQTSLSPTFSVQAEFRHRETKHGDLSFNFDMDNFDPSFRRTERIDTVRVGAHYAPAPHSDLIASVIYKDAADIQESKDSKLDGTTKGYISEAQYLFRIPYLNGVVGGGYYSMNSEGIFDIDEFDTQHRNVYVYTQLRYPARVTWTIGASFDSLDDGFLGDFKQVSPKFGILWNLTPSTTLRLAAFRVLKRTLVADQTLEATQVAGFNQFFDDFDGTESKRYGIAIDQKFLGDLYGGLEVSKRDLEVPIAIDVGKSAIEKWKEEVYRAYIDWTPHQTLATSIEYEREYFNSGEPPLVPNTDTHFLPVTLSYYHPSGIFAQLKTTYVNQKVEFSNGKDRDESVLTDAAIGYRLPKRYGSIQMGVKNLLDEEFDFQGLRLRTSQPLQEAPQFIPDRTIFVRFTLAL